MQNLKFVFSSPFVRKILANKFLPYCLGLSFLGFSSSAAFGDLEWSGLYRFEAYHINNSELTKDGHRKEYGLHHLILRPRIVASDGLMIHSQFNIFNADGATYANSQMGQIWGHGVGAGQGNTNNAQDSNALSGHQKSETIAVNELYLTYNHAFGSLIAGRAPLHFGLGMNFNAGKGLFDHWLENRDLVGYKVVFGNLSFFPMYAKVSEGAINRSDDVTDYIMHLQYENPETDLEMGVIYHHRRASDAGSDAPFTELGGVNNNSKISARTWGLYALRNEETIRLGVEAAFQDGNIGVRTADGREVTQNGFGLAGEFEWRPQISKWKWGTRAGYATGDDPTTNDKYEGFIFSRNYDVAFLMFNHPLGKEDLLRTSAYGGGPEGNVVTTTDTETISNVFYLSPYFKYQWRDNMFMTTTLTTGWLGTNPIQGRDVKKDLGFELDLALTFEPRRGVQWVNELGLLFPGGAFEAGGQYDPGFTFGFASKAAISF